MSIQTTKPQYLKIRPRPQTPFNTIESTINLSKDIKNTLLIDTIAFKFQKKNFTCLEKNYDSIVMIKNENYLYHKLMCRPTNISASELTSEPEDSLRPPEPRQNAIDHELQYTQIDFIRNFGRTRKRDKFAKKLVN